MACPHAWNTLLGSLKDVYTSLVMERAWDTGKTLKHAHWGTRTTWEPPCTWMSLRRSISEMCWWDWGASRISEDDVQKGMCEGGCRRGWLWGCWSSREAMDTITDGE